MKTGKESEMSTDDFELANLNNLARLAEHFMNAALDRLPDPQTLDLQTQLAIQGPMALSEQAGEKMVAIEDASMALLCREPPPDNARLRAAATRLCRMTIRAGEAFAMLAARIVSEEGLPKLLAAEDHERAISDAFLNTRGPIPGEGFRAVVEQIAAYGDELPGGWRGSQAANVRRFVERMSEGGRTFAAEVILHLIPPGRSRIKGTAGRYNHRRRRAAW